MLYSPPCDAGVVAQIFVRQSSSLQPIHDIRSGCSKALNFQLLRMVAKKDQLLASICAQCDGRGFYQGAAIGFHSLHAMRLDPDCAARWQFMESPRN